MKILQVISSFPPAYAYGGPPRSAYQLSTALVERGHDVTVFATDAKDANTRVTGYENPESMDGINVYRFRNVSNRLAWANFPIAPGLALALRRRVAEFDVVHIQEFRTMQAAFVHRYATRVGVPYVLQTRGGVPRESKSRQKRLFDTIFGTDILRDAECLVASSDVEAAGYDGVVPNGERVPVEHIPNGVNVSEYSRPVENGAFRRKIGLSERTPLVLFLGRLHPIKNLDLLLRAFAQVRKNGVPDAHLVVAGPDEGKESGLRESAAELGLSDHVSFPGPLYDETKQQAYTDADVFVLPSRYESFGNVVVESLACGTPVVVTENCGVAQWIADDVGSVVSPTVSTLSDEIISMINSNHGPKTAQLCQSFARQFDWESVAEDVEDIYNPIV